MNICEQGYRNLIEGYLKQFVIDYGRAVEKGNINEMISIEDDIQSDDYLGDICGISSGIMLKKIRLYGFDIDKYEIKRDEYGYPIEIIKKEIKQIGKSRGRKIKETAGAGEKYLFHFEAKQS